MVRNRSDRVRYIQRSFTEILRNSPRVSFDRYALLDAQDWMNDADLTSLWTKITRTPAWRARHFPHRGRRAASAGPPSRGAPCSLDL